MFAHRSLLHIYSELSTTIISIGSMCNGHRLVYQPNHRSISCRCTQNKRISIQMNCIANRLMAVQHKCSHWITHCNRQVMKIEIFRNDSVISFSIGNYVCICIWIVANKSQGSVTSYGRCPQTHFGCDSAFESFSESFKRKLTFNCVFIGNKPPANISFVG